MIKIIIFFIKRPVMTGSLFFWLMATSATFNHVFAQPAWDVSVAPSTAYIQVLPGSTATHTITLTNTGQSDLVIYPTIVDFAPDGVTGQPVLSDSTTFPYFDTNPAQLPPLTIPENKKAQLTLLISTPNEAPEREWPLVVLFQQKPKDVILPNMIDAGQIPSSNSQITGTIGSNLVVLVSNQKQHPYLLSTDEIKTPFLVDSFRDLEISVLLKNNGVSAAVASGSAHLTNIFDKIVLTAPLYPDTILGLSTRAARIASPSQSTTPSDPLPDPKTPESNLQPHPLIISNQILIGIYQISISLSNPLTGQSEVKSASFIAFPWSILLFITVGGLSYLVITITLKRNKIS